MTYRNIFLIGPMGAGKSSVGAALARRLRLRFCDSDEVVARAAGRDVAAIFAAEGEAGFRRREAAAIRELAAEEGIVCATGGGCVLSGQNRRLLKDGNAVVWLRADLDRRAARVAGGDDRPLLAGRDARAELARLERERRPLYQALADCIVDNDGLMDAVVEKIARFIGGTTETEDRER